MGTPNTQVVRWDTAGNPYWDTSDGGKFYFSPSVAMSMWNDPKALAWAKAKGFYIDGGQAGLDQRAPGTNPVHEAPPGGGVFRETGTWNPQQGGWDQPLDWGNIASLAIGGFLTAGVGSAIAGGGAAAPGATAAAPGSTINGIATLPAGLPSGQAGINAALAGGSGAGWGSTAGNIARVALGGKPGGAMGAWDWIGPAISVGSQLYGAKLQSDAASANTDAMAAAQKYSADLQAKATADALNFARQQAETDWRNQEIARQGNYGQWAAREGRISDFGNTVGLPARQIPGYVAGIDPGFMGGGMPSTIAGAAQGPSSAPSGPAPTVSAAAGAIAPQVAAYFKARGVTPNPTSVDYWAQKWNEFGAKDPAYFNQRLAIADEFGGGAPAAASSATTNRFYPMANPGIVPDYMTPLVSPGVQLPSTIAGVLR